MKQMILMMLSTLCLLQSSFLSAADDPEKVPVASQFAQLMPVIDGLLTAVRQDNAEKAYNEFTAADFRKTTTFEQFKQFAAKYPVLSKNKSFQFHSLYFEDNIGTFQGALVSSSGEQLETEIDLIEENGKWKILGIQLFKPESSMLRPDQK